MVRCVPVCVALWFVLAAPLRATAADGDVFEVPGTCGSARELDEALEALVGPRARERGRVQLRAEPAGYALEITLQDGTRTMRAEDCRALFDAALVVLGVALSEKAAHDAPPAEPEASALRAEGASERPREPRRSPRTVRSFGALHAGAGFGLVPSVAAELALAAGVEVGRWGVRAAASYVLPREAEGRGTAVRVQAGGGRIAATLRPFRPCTLAVGIDVHALHGRGVRGLSTPRGGTAWVWGPHLDTVWTLVDGRRAALELDVGAAYRPQVARFQRVDGGKLYRTEHFHLRGGLGVRVHFD